jgi:HK97 gp10 family phage protein
MAVESLTFKATGFKELEEVLIEMGEDLCYGKTASRVLIPAVKSAMQPVLQTAKQMAPYDESNNTSQHLRDTLKLTVRVPTPRDQKSMYVEKSDIVMGLVSVRTDKRGISQEFGNARVPAKPFMRRALEGQANQVVNILGTYLTFKLQQYKAKKG